ncbi:hypothetical protein BGW80DRAFT_1458633 [Lactifluus volemus]|nr:hypothetical protein BGW80DRAFT_1458633 [Lactifluus volemus]
MTLQDVLLDLTKEDVAEAAQGCISPHKVILTMFLIMALNLEEQQCHLQLEVSKMKGTQTSKQLADLEEKCMSLCNQILLWCQAQLGYTPCVASLVMQLALLDAAELPLSLPQHLQQLSEITTKSDANIRLFWNYGNSKGSMLMALETGPAHICKHYITNSTSVLNEVLGATMQHAVLFLFLIQMEADNPI